MAQPVTQILSEKEVIKMLKRLAYQVYERNIDEKELIVAGISSNGNRVAELLCAELSEISNLKITLKQISINKEQPAPDQVFLDSPSVLTQKSVLVVDDVLNTGKTFAYALLPFLGKGTKKIQTLVLVDRNHRMYPIRADYIGLSLSTTLQEHVEVKFTKKKVTVNLR